MTDRRYLLNTETGTVHDLDHLTENCNTDQIERRDRKRAKTLLALKADPRYRRTCSYCMKPKVIENPDGPQR